MSIKLRPKVLEELEQEVSRFLELTNVNHGSILDVLPSFGVLWEAEALLPREGPTRQQLNRYLGEHSLSAFIPAELQQRMLALKYEPEKASEPLLKVLETDDPRPLARELLQGLANLPRSYWATLPLPANLAEFVKCLDPVYSFGPGVRLVHDPDKLQRFTPTNALPAAAIFGMAPLFGSPFSPSGPQAALQVQVDGFIPRFGSGETADEAHGMFKSFFGLGLAVGLLKTADFPQPQAGRLSISFDQVDSSEEQPLSRMPLTDSETTAISGLRYAAKSNRDRRDLTDAERRMADMEAILSAPEQHQLLLRASRWLFDSHVSEDPLLSFVQATVVLEILLGEKASSDEVGLSTLLANRCAYMIGASTSERTNVIKQFKTLYGTRSQIVHSGKHRLFASEKVQLHQLRGLGRRVICAEINLAIEEIRRSQARAAHT